MKSKTDIRTLSEKELNARLVRDLTEACPAGEREALAAWRAADPAHEEEYARIRSYWNARVTTTRSIDPEREFRKLQRRIAAGSESRRSGMLRLLATRMGRYASMAAMLAVGLFCGWALSGPRAAERFAFITGSSISSFELPDGSRITLDKESRLEYDGDFGRDERNVRLVGKGFFEVEKMPDKRFVVEMGDVQVSVLGTTFDASNRTEEGIVSASLVEGSVAFRAGNQNLRLTPSRRAVYHVGSGKSPSANSIPRSRPPGRTICSATNRSLWRRSSNNSPRVTTSASSPMRETSAGPAFQVRSKHGCPSSRRSTS